MRQAVSGRGPQKHTQPHFEKILMGYGSSWYILVLTAYSSVHTHT